MAFADGRFDFSPVAASPRPPRKPDRFPMTAPTAKDLRRLTKKPVLKPKPVVGEYCFGSRIRFDPSMLPPARRFAVAGERAAETKKKMKKKTAGKKKRRRRRREEEEDASFGERRSLRETSSRNRETRGRGTREGRDARHAARRGGGRRSRPAPTRAGYLRRRRFGISRRMKYTFCKKIAASVTRRAALFPSRWLARLLL